jgi:hypothetical protein
MPTQTHVPRLTTPVNRNDTQRKRSHPAGWLLLRCARRRSTAHHSPTVSSRVPQGGHDTTVSNTVLTDIHSPNTTPSLISPSIVKRIPDIILPGQGCVAGTPCRHDISRLALRDVALTPWKDAAPCMSQTANSINHASESRWSWSGPACQCAPTASLSRSLVASFRSVKACANKR